MILRWFCYWASVKEKLNFFTFQFYICEYFILCLFFPSTHLFCVVFFVFFCIAGLWLMKSTLPLIAYSAYLIRAWSPPRSSSAACAATSIHAATGYRGSSTATTPSAPLVWRECPSWRVQSTPSPALSVVGLPAPEPAWLCQGLCGSTQKSGTRFPRSKIRMRTIQWRIWKTQSRYSSSTHCKYKLQNCGPVPLNFFFFERSCSLYLT